MESALFLRLAVSRDKEGIMALAQKGIEIQKPEDVIKSTYTLEFLNLPELDQYTEGDLETRIIDNLQKFCWNWVKALLLLAVNIHLQLTILRIIVIWYFIIEY